MQVQYYSEIQPAFTCPDIRDVTSPFLVWLIRREVTIQQEFYQLLSYKGDVDLEAKLDEWEGNPPVFNGAQP